MSLESENQSVVETAEPVSPTPANTSLLQKAASFVSAEVLWFSYGRPFRSAHDFNHIYYKVCRPCEHFANDACRVCGCRIVPNEQSWFNKISMATTNCPLPEPKWVSSITPPESLTLEVYEAALKNSKAVLVEVTAPEPVPLPSPTIPQGMDFDKKKDGAGAGVVNPFVRTGTGQIVQGDEP